MTKKLPEITTVGQMRKILAYYDDSTPIYLLEYRYSGGGDEEFDCNITVSEHHNCLIITPVADGSIYGTPLNPEEL